jgi:hypothetical protein
MPRWEAFEPDPQAVRDQIERGTLDYVEVVTDLTETKFFRHLFSATPWENLVASFPSPRKKAEVPVWLYLSSQITLRLHAATGYGAYPYVMHCGGLKEVLGEQQVRWKEDPDSGRWHLECQGYNDKNDYARVTPCDPDFLRKLARDTPVDALHRWFGHAVPQYVRDGGLWDDEGIVLVDGSYLFVPDNEKYEQSCVLRFDEHNHPVDREKLSDQELRRTRVRRCYRMINLVHTNRRRDYGLYVGVRVGSGKMPEAPQLAPMVKHLHEAMGKGRVKLVIFDRGFIDGATVKELKSLGIDSLFPLKKDMLDYQDAWRLARADESPWQVWKPPSAPALDCPPQRPDHIRAREAKRQKTVAAKKAALPEPVRIDRVEMKLIPGMQLWQECGVPLQVAVLREYRTDGKILEWALATTRAIADPLEVWDLYGVRTEIEEKHRQSKCFWDLSAFRAPNYALVVNQVVFTLLAYTLMQVFLEKNDRKELTRATRERMCDGLLPRGDKIAAYAANYVALLNAAEYGEWLLGAGEGARRRLRGRLRDIDRQRCSPPALPLRHDP